MRALALAALLAAPAAAGEAPLVPVPDGYVLQKLDFTEGQLARPKDWFYESSATDSGWLWTIAKEDASKGPYATGMRIQMFVGFEKYGMTSEGFIQAFLKRESETATRLSDCAPSEAGMFTRQCLEVLEPDHEHPGAKFHIQYSIFRNDKMAFIVTFGAPQDKWQEAQPIAKVMSNVVIIGKDFGKDLDKKKE